MTHFAVWRAGLWAIATLACGTLAAWAGTRGMPAAAWSLVWLPVAVVASLHATLRPFRLAWDGQAWRLDDAVGDAAVAIDLGHWLLLRWKPHAAAAGRHAAWLPLQRSGLEASWHALRCALYGTRAAAGTEVNP